MIVLSKQQFENKIKEDIINWYYENLDNFLLYSGDWKEFVENKVKTVFGINIKMKNYSLFSMKIIL